MLNATRFLLHDISLGYIKLWAFWYQEAVIYGLNFNLILKNYNVIVQENKPKQVLCQYWHTKI